jgi:hypothetical protein
MAARGGRPPAPPAPAPCPAGAVGVLFGGDEILGPTGVSSELKPD